MTVRCLCIFRALAAITHLGLAAACVGQEACTLGRDRLLFPKAVALPSGDEQAALARMWHPAGKDLRREHTAIPFRETVELGRGGKGLAIPILREHGTYARAQWDSVGQFLERIDGATQMEALLSLLHGEGMKSRVTAQQFQRVARAVEAAGKDVPMRVTSKEVDAKMVDRGCFVENGTWFADLLIVEGASVVEYKYAIDKRNRIARLRRVLVEGPEPIGQNWDPVISSDEAVELGTGKVVKVQPYDEAAYRRCWDLLQAAAFPKEPEKAP